MPAPPTVDRRRRGEPAPRRRPLRLQRPAVGRVLVHDTAGHGALPLALALVPGLARRAVGPRARGVARRRDRVPARAADRGLRSDRHRLDRLLVRQPRHLVRLAERPATIERRLYDELNAAAGKSQELVAAAVAEGQKHVLALGEMTTAEKAHGYISRAEDQDPYLSRVREAVAREARATAPPTPRARGRGCATRPSTGTRASPARPWRASRRHSGRSPTSAPA